MPYDAVLELKNHMEEFASSSTRSRADYIDLMRRFRMALEHKGLDKKYETLYFYCNWVMHPGIAKNRYGYDLLLEIDAAVFADQAVGPTVDGVAKALGLGELHDEIFGMLDEFGIDKIALKSDWEKFQKSLLRDLVSKEISLPQQLGNKGPAFEAKEAMRQDRIAKGQRDDLTVVKFYLSFHPAGSSGRPAGYYFNVGLHQIATVELNAHLF